MIVIVCQCIPLVHTRTTYYWVNTQRLTVNRWFDNTRISKFAIALIYQCSELHKCWLLSWIISDWISALFVLNSQLVYGLLQHYQLCIFFPTLLSRSEKSNEVPLWLKSPRNGEPACLLMWLTQLALFLTTSTV